MLKLDANFEETETFHQLNGMYASGGHACSGSSSCAYLTALHGVTFTRFGAYLGFFLQLCGHASSTRAITSSSSRIGS